MGMQDCRAYFYLNCLTLKLVSRLQFSTEVFLLVLVKRILICPSLDFICFNGKMTPRYVLSSLDTLCTYTMYVLQLKFTKEYLHRRWVKCF